MRWHVMNYSVIGKAESRQAEDSASTKTNKAPDFSEALSAL
jgi:hypothetical protein